MRNAPSPPIAISASPPDLAEAAHDLVGDVDRHLLAVASADELERVALVDGAEDRAAQVGDAAHLVTRQVDEADSGWLQQAVVTAADAGDLPAAPQPDKRDGANDSVQAGRVAPPVLTRTCMPSRPYRGCTRSAREAFGNNTRTKNRLETADSRRDRAGPEIVSSAAGFSPAWSACRGRSGGGAARRPARPPRRPRTSGVPSRCWRARW